MTYDHDGAHLAFASVDRSVRIIDLNVSREPLILSDHVEGFASVAFSRDGKTVATGGGAPPEVIQEPLGKVAPLDQGERPIRLWNAATGIERSRLPGHKGSIHALAFGPGDDQLASAGADGYVRVWNMSAGKVVWSMTQGPSPLLALAYSPDGTILAVAGVDKTIRSHDATTGRLIHTLVGHDNWVMGIAFSPDGSRLASAGADETVRIWDVVRGHELLSLRGPKDRVHSVAFSPDGISLAAASADGQVWVWQGTPDSLRAAGRNRRRRPHPQLTPARTPFHSISKKTGLVPPLLVHYQEE